MGLRDWFNKNVLGQKETSATELPEFDGHPAVKMLADHLVARAGETGPREFNNLRQDQVMAIQEWMNANGGHIAFGENGAVSFDTTQMSATALNRLKDIAFNYRPQPESAYVGPDAGRTSETGRAATDLPMEIPAESVGMEPTPEKAPKQNGLQKVANWFERHEGRYGEPHNKDKFIKFNNISQEDQQQIKDLLNKAGCPGAMQAGERDGQIQINSSMFTPEAREALKENQTITPRQETCLEAKRSGGRLARMAQGLANQSDKLTGKAEKFDHGVDHAKQKVADGAKVVKDKTVQAAVAVDKTVLRPKVHAIRDLKGQVAELTEMVKNGGVAPEKPVEEKASAEPVNRDHREGRTTRMTKVVTAKLGALVEPMQKADDAVDRAKESVREAGRKCKNKLLAFGAAVKEKAGQLADAAVGAYETVKNEIKEADRKFGESVEQFGQKVGYHGAAAAHEVEVAAVKLDKNVLRPKVHAIRDLKGQVAALTEIVKQQGGQFNGAAVHNGSIQAGSNGEVSKGSLEKQ